MPVPERLWAQSLALFVESEQLLPAEPDAAALNGLACAQGDDTPLGMAHLYPQWTNLFVVHLSGNADGDGLAVYLTGYGADCEFPFDMELSSSVHLIDDLLVDRPPCVGGNCGEQENHSVPDG